MFSFHSTLHFCKSYEYHFCTTKSSFSSDSKIYIKVCRYVGRETKKEINLPRLHVYPYCLILSSRIPGFLNCRYLQTRYFHGFTDYLLFLFSPCHIFQLASIELVLTITVLLCGLYVCTTAAVFNIPPSR
jgi:hypothetical protein